MKFNYPDLGKQFLNVARVVESIEKAKVQATGQIGEWVFDTLAKEYLDDSYKIMSDVVLKFDNGTTQIDQIIVSLYGIIVVEVKTYKGWIYGSNGRWTQKLYRRQYRFQNPLKQNCKHINALQHLLKLPDEMFRSLIVFSGEAKFRTVMPENIVRGGMEYLNYIKKLKTVIFDGYAVEEIVKMIKANRLSSADHQKYMVRQKAKYDAGDINRPPSCPGCDKKMILRETKRGHYKGKRFWGCQNYPRCKVILEFKDDKEIRDEKIRRIEKAFDMFFG